jgi:hypothetical protein
LTAEFLLKPLSIKQGLRVIITDAGVCEPDLTWIKFVFFVDADYAASNFKVTMPRFLELVGGSNQFT